MLSRSRFQLHLSTLVLISIMTGGILWLNWSHRYYISSTAELDTWLSEKLPYPTPVGERQPKDTKAMYSMGWPYYCIDNFVLVDETSGGKFVNQHFDDGWGISWFHALCNAFVAAVFLGVFATVAEWGIRRRIRKHRVTVQADPPFPAPK